MTLTPRDALQLYHDVLLRCGYSLDEIRGFVLAVDPGWRLNNKDFIEALTQDLAQRQQEVRVG